MIYNDSEKLKKITGLLKNTRPNIVFSQEKKDQIKRAIFQKMESETNLGFERSISKERNFIMNTKIRYIMATIFGLALVGTTAFASNSARPGDALFGIKKISEKAKISLTSSEESKAQLQSNIADQRLEDVAQVSEEHKVVAKQEAQVETNNAIEVLNRVKADLLAKNNTTAAAAIDQTIARLQAKAKDNEVEVDANVDDNNATDDSINQEEDQDGSNQKNQSEGLNVNVRGTGSLNDKTNQNNNTSGQDSSESD